MVLNPTDTCDLLRFSLLEPDLQPRNVSVIQGPAFRSQMQNHQAEHRLQDDVHHEPHAKEQLLVPVGTLGTEEQGCAPDRGLKLVATALTRAHRTKLRFSPITNLHERWTHSTIHPPVTGPKVFLHLDLATAKIDEITCNCLPHIIFFFCECDFHADPFSPLHTSSCVTRSAKLVKC